VRQYYCNFAIHNIAKKCRVYICNISDIRARQVGSHPLAGRSLLGFRENETYVHANEPFYLEEISSQKRNETIVGKQAHFRRTYRLTNQKRKKKGKQSNFSQSHNSSWACEREGEKCPHMEQNLKFLCSIRLLLRFEERERKRYSSYMKTDFSKSHKSS
jgi:hypothetical protein